MPVQLDKGRSTILQFNVTWEIIIRCSTWQIYSSMVSVPKWTRSQSIPFEMCISDMLQPPAKQPSPAGPPKRLPQCRSLTSRSASDPLWSTDAELSFPHVLREWWDLEAFPWCSADLNSPNPLHLLRIYSKNIQDCTTVGWEQIGIKRTSNGKHRCKKVKVSAIETPTSCSSGALKMLHRTEKEILGVAGQFDNGIFQQAPCHGYIQSLFPGDWA